MLNLTTDDWHDEFGDIRVDWDLGHGNLAFYDGFGVFMCDCVYLSCPIADEIDVY